MPKQVFKDPILEKEFNKKGYVVIPFLNDDEINYFKEKFFDTINESCGPKIGPNVDFNANKEIGYDFTFIDNNIDYKKKVFDIITEKFNSKANSYLLDYKPIIANYIRKKEGGGEVPMHQNWAFVDEEKYTSVSVWVPLVDSNEENGTLQMVDGSHKRFGQYRGPMVPWELRKLKEEIVAKHLTPMTVKAGQAVILDDSIVHYSNINKTPGLRLAIQLIMIPTEASSVHYHLDKAVDPTNINVLETDVDFYTNFHPWLKPKGLKEIKKIPFNEKIFTYEDFLNGLKAPRFDGYHSTTERQNYSSFFKDSLLQEQFSKDGYVKLQLLDAAEIADLKEFYLSLKHEHIGNYGFHVSLDSKDEQYIKTVFDKLFKTLKPKLNPILKDYKTFTASYVIKEAGLQNIVPPHQDWSFVDEEQFCSATVWIPLMDVNKANGALGVIKGSHLLFNSPRNSPSPQSKSILSEHLFTLFPYIDVIDMKAGEALIFDNRLIHASPPNISNQTRIGVGIGITQSDAQLLHYYELPGSNMIEVYNVDDIFFEKYNNAKFSELYNNGMKPTELELRQTIIKSVPKLSKEEMIQLITSKTNAKPNMALMSELAELYQYNVDGTPKNKTSALKEEGHHLIEHKPVQNQPAYAEWKDERTFFQKYTPKNILAEIKYRLNNLN
ncbi:MAG: phytanoyl-CoA dioxygenase family protein [Bacteroidetes bacterium]|nr:phytanoyl-CoA dioxygenase family protein [Bacteroidota bacterium]